MRETPIVITSASEYEAEARRADADIFLRKPGDIRRIVESVARLLERRGA
jgi:PHD/YefM family antitoxin component YafN of YafNO toxin-antitoxin module